VAEIDELETIVRAAGNPLTAEGDGTINS
jgi:hypothetical protein